MVVAENLQLTDDERAEKVREYCRLRDEKLDIENSSECLGMARLREIVRIDNVGGRFTAI